MKTKTKPTPSFKVEIFLNSSGFDRKVQEFRRRESIYRQGDDADCVMYIRQGGVRLSVVSEAGKEAVVAILGPGEFFGEGCLSGQSVRIGSATAITACSILLIERKEMVRVLHTERQFSDRFIAYMLTRNIRVEADLVDQLFNSTEKRLARALLLLAQYGEKDRPQEIVINVSQETLAKTIGTTRSRVNVFMNKFRKLGFIDYNGGLQINRSLLSVVLHD
jgi:CRP/FNR family transcriptional regulator, cyclic AMP receptor protein